MTRHVSVILGMAFVAHVASAQFVQQGNKLVGTGAVGPAQQGNSVAISADGSTAVVGGPRDNSGSGAAWVFARSGGVWSQQGVKLLGTDSVFPASQGQSVAVSADGNTAIVGGPGDTSNAGAAWIFTRSQGAWSQQGSKLVGSDAVGTPRQGYSVAISADGNTAIVGGPGDDSGSSGSGAAWVFTRNGVAWSQQGSKLFGTGSPFPSGGQGASVAISADGNTAIVGAPGLSSYGGGGAVWVYTRIGGVWSQQGGALYGTSPLPVGQIGMWFFGDSVAISSDGTTAIVGGRSGSCSSCFSGPAWWVFTRSGEVWSQQWSALGGSQVAISGDGSTALVGRQMYARTGGVWAPQGTALIGTGATGDAGQGSSVAISADGSTAVLGGPTDNSGVGAAWAFASSNCTAPWIYTQPLSQGFLSAQAATIFVAATGTMPLAYQWYQGSSGDTSAPVGTNSSSFTTPTLTTTTSYWVRVGNSCGHADSATATVWIGCIPPSITSQPQNQSIQTGQSATLSVTASGAPLSYQWYQGASGDTSAPGGANASSFTTPTLTTTTSFWVRVSNSCGHADSGTAVVLVGPAFAYFTWVPVASHNPGLNQSQWRSDLGLLNTGTVQANVQLEFFGGGMLSNAAYVPAGVQTILADVVGQLGGSGSGAIEVISDQPLKVTARSYNVVSSTANCYAGGTQGQDYPAVPSGAGLAATQSAYLAGLAENASFHCNIGVVNTGTTSATVLVELFDSGGTKVAEYPVTLSPGEWKQETQPFLHKAGQTAMDRGYARVTVQSGSGVFAFASLIDNITNDPTTVAMQR